MVKVLFSSVIREPEYTALSSQMDRILPTDLITLRSPSELEKNQEHDHGQPQTLLIWVFVIAPWLFIHDAENQAEYQRHDSLDQRAGVRQDLGEGCPVNDGVFPLTVLDDVIGHVK